MGYKAIAKSNGAPLSPPSIFVSCVVWRFRGSSVLRNHVAFHVEGTFMGFLDFPRDSVALSNRFGRYHMNSRDLCQSLVASLLADTTIV